MRTPHLAPLFIVAFLLLSCGDSKDATGPGTTDGPASFEVTLPASIQAGQPFSLTVTAVSRSGAKPDPTFSGPVQLSASSGTLSPGSLTLASGVGTGEVTLSGDGGQVSITARSGTVSGSAATTVVGTAPAVRLEILPSTVLLTETGAARQLTAVGYDAAGQPTAVTVAWRSTDPGTVAVGPDGMATAASALGSSIITASAGGVTSPPVLAVVAQPAAGAVLVADEQVVDGPTPLSDPDDYGPGWQYRMTLTDLAVPAAGTLLLASGGEAVAGRVVSASASGDHVLVTLELVPMDEMFERLVINQAIPLDDVPVALADGMAPHYHIQRAPMGTTRFLPRAPGTAWSPAELRVAADAASTTFNLGPFSCTAAGSVPQLDLPQPKLEVKQKLTFHLVYDDVFEKLSLEGEVDANFEYRPVFKAVFEGKLSCDRVIAKLVIPVSGFATWAFAGIVPIGIGMDLDAKLTVAEVGLEVKASAGATMELGVACPGGGGCGAITTFEAKPFTPSFAFISPAPSEQLRIELGGYGYALARLALGSPLSESLQFSFIEAKAGVKQSIDLKSAYAQAKDEAYASDFKLESKIGVGPGKDLKKALTGVGDLLGVKLNFSIDLLPDLDPLAESPKGTFTILPATVAPGDSTEQGELATFTVVLDPITYLGIQSVDRVEFFWRRDVEGSPGEFTLESGRPACRSVAAAPGQTTFTCQTDFLEEHVGEQTFHAFVHARLFGVPIAIPLEVAPDARATVLVEPEGVCGEAPEWAEAYIRDYSYVNEGEGTGSILGPNISHTSISGGASSTASGDGWSPSGFLDGSTLDYLQIVPLVPTSARFLRAVAQVSGQANATVSKDNCCGRFGDATAQISLGGFGSTLRAAAGSSYDGDLTHEQSTQINEVNNLQLPVAGPDDRWGGAGFWISGWTRNRGAGKSAQVDGSLGVVILDVIDEEDNSVPALICSAAGVSYGATVAGSPADGARAVASRPLRQVREGR